MKKSNSFIIISIGLIIIVSLNLAINIYHITSFYNRKNSENERWQQVEQRLIEMESKIQTLENR